MQAHSLTTWLVHTAGVVEALLLMRANASALPGAQSGYLAAASVASGALAALSAPNLVQQEPTGRATLQYFSFATAEPALAGTSFTLLTCVSSILYLQERFVSLSWKGMS